MSVAHQMRPAPRTYYEQLAREGRRSVLSTCRSTRAPPRARDRQLVADRDDARRIFPLDRRETLRGRARRVRQTTRPRSRPTSRRTCRPPAPRETHFELAEGPASRGGVGPLLHPVLVDRLARPPRDRAFREGDPAAGGVPAALPRPRQLRRLVRRARRRRDGGGALRPRAVRGDVLGARQRRAARARAGDAAARAADRATVARPEGHGYGAAAGRAGPPRSADAPARARVKRVLRAGSRSSWSRPHRARGRPGAVEGVHADDRLVRHLHARRPRAESCGRSPTALLVVLPDGRPAFEGSGPTRSCTAAGPGRPAPCFRAGVGVPVDPRARAGHRRHAAARARGCHQREGMIVIAGPQVDGRARARRRDHLRPRPDAALADGGGRARRGRRPSALRGLRRGVVASRELREIDVRPRRGTSHGWRGRHPRGRGAPARRAVQARRADARRARGGGSPMTRFGVMKHLRVLEEAGLVVDQAAWPREAALPESRAHPADPRPVDRASTPSPGPRC